MQDTTALVSGWLLAGGQSRRMGGLDKGLQPYQGQIMAERIIQILRPQVGWIGVSANRHATEYAQLLGSDQVFADDPDLPTDSGPLAGILTGLRHAPTDWLMVCPCDSPLIPADLVARLLAQAQQQNADVATVFTPDRHTPGGQEKRSHWVHSLIHKRVCPKLHDQFVKGERKVGRFIESLNWTAVSFDDPSAFANMNTLESLHGRA